MDDEVGFPPLINTLENPPTQLSLKNSTQPSQQGSLLGKVKKALIVGLATSGAFSLVCVPIIASANFLSDVLQKSASYSYASDTSFNSQNFPLLAAAKNIDPNPSVGGGDIVLVHGEALVPTDNPLGGDADTVSRPSNSQISVYIVREGDTLSSVAAMFKVTQNTIIGANDIKNGVIHPGQELIILPITGVQHVVIKDETIASLAKKFKSDPTDIVTYNNLSEDKVLVVGQTIIIPNGELVAVAPTQSTISKTKLKSKIAKTSKAFKGAPLRDAGGPEYANYYVWPVGGGIITQSLHGYNGVDIGAPTGSDIYASAGGTVIIAKFNGGWNGGYGNYIVVSHDNGTQTLYSHASRVLVSAGDSVTQGQLIGKVGRTGEATGPHLHFEVRGATNPFGAIAVGQGE